MKRLRLFKRFLLFSRRRPFWFFAIITTPVVVLYFFLGLFSWGIEVREFISLMFSVEAGIALKIKKNIPFWDIVFLALASHGANILVDMFVVRTLLLSRRIRQFVHVLSVMGKQLIALVKAYWKEFIRLVKKIFSRDTIASLPHNEVVRVPSLKKNFIVRFWNHLNEVRKDPTKAGLWTVYFFCLLPRLPTPIGGVGMAVFLVQYNKMNWKGWLVILVGVISHLVWVLAVEYGIFSLF